MARRPSKRRPQHGPEKDLERRKRGVVLRRPHARTGAGDDGETVPGPTTLISNRRQGSGAISMLIVLLLFAYYHELRIHRACVCGLPVSHTDNRHRDVFLQQMMSSKENVRQLHAISSCHASVSMLLMRSPIGQLPCGSIRLSLRAGDPVQPYGSSNHCRFRKRAARISKSEAEVEFRRRASCSAVHIVRRRVPFSTRSLFASWHNCENECKQYGCLRDTLADAFPTSQCSFHRVESIQACIAVSESCLPFRSPINRA